MNGHVQCGGCGKANSVVVRADGSRDVIHWRLGNHNVPAVHRVRATLVRFPWQHYVHANYGPEVMAVRSENIARLGWSSLSFNMPLIPEVVGHFNLLGQAAAVVHKEFRGGPTKARVEHPTTIRLWTPREGCDQFRVYLNLSGREFYDLLFVVGSEHGPSSQFDVAPANVGTVPKLLAWLRPFEASKKKLYRDHGFDWNPRRGPIELSPTRGDL
jgi:hypothetical protein